MLAFLRSNLYPTAIAQQPELKARTDQLRFTLLSRSMKIRDNIKKGIQPGSGSGSGSGSDYEPELIETAAGAEIILKELRFCKLTMNFILSVTGKYHESAYDNVDRYIEYNDQDNQDNQDLNEDLEEGPAELEDACASRDDNNRDRDLTSEQKHSSRLIGEAFQMNAVYIQLCSSLGISCLHATLLDKTSSNAAFDAEMFKSIHHAIQERSVAELTISTLCDLSRELWQMMNALAFANLYRYHYEFQKNQMVTAPPNPEDSIFNMH